MAVQINVAANQAALMASIQAGVQAYNRNFAAQNTINLSINQRAFSQPLGRITGDVKDFEAALAASNARVIAFGASTAILGGAIRSFKSIADATIEVEKNLTDINRVFGLTTKELQKFSTDLFNVSKQTASSFKDASQAALEFSRQGVKAEEVLQRTTDAMTLARLAGMNVNNAIEALTATVNGFQATGITTTQVLNKLVAVEQSYAVSAGDLAEALSRTGLAAQEAGVNIDQLNALVTSAQEKTARGGAVIGNALKTIFTRLQRPETLDQLEAFNIGVRDIQGNILPAVTILKNFAAAYSNLADTQKAQLSEQVAGVYQVNILKAILGDLNNTQGAYAGALMKGASATNEAQIAAAKLNQTLDALLSQTSTVAQQFANNVGKVTFEPLAKYTAETFKSLFENINQILEGEGLGSTFANGLLKGIRNILAGPGAIGAFFVLTKLLQNSFSYLTQALPQIVGITTETQNRKNLEQAILQIMQQQGPVSQALAGQMGNQTAQAQLLLQIARQQTAEYQRQQALVKGLAPTLSMQGVVIGKSGGLQVTRSQGFIPNFEESSAKSLGASSNVKAVKGSGKIGGKSFIANNQEIQIPNFAGSGETAVIPTYGGGIQKAIGMIGSGKSGSILSNGFIPNFASNTSRFRIGFAFEQAINKALSGEFVTAGPDLLDFPYGDIKKNVLLRASQQDKQKIGISNNTVYGDAKLTPADTNVRDFGKKLFGSLEPQVLNQIIDSALNSKGLISLNRFLPAVPSLLVKGVGTDSYSKSARTIGSVVGNLARLQNNQSPFSKLKGKQKTKVFDTKFLFDYLLDYVNVSSGFIPNFAYAGADAIRTAVENGTIEQYRVPGTKTFSFPSGTASQAQVDAIAKRATKGTVGQAGKITYAGGPNFTSIAMTSGGQQLVDDAYENLIKSKIPNLISAHGNSVNFSLPFSGGPNSFIDFFDPSSKTFYEAKGGGYEKSDVANKFVNARTDLQNQLNKQLQDWKNVLVYNPDYASSGYIPNFANAEYILETLKRIKEGTSGFSKVEQEAFLRKFGANQGGSISKSQTLLSKKLFGRSLDQDALTYIARQSPNRLTEMLRSNFLSGVVNFDIDESLRRNSIFTENKGFIPNFAKFKSKYGTATIGKTDPIDLEFFSKTLGRKITASQIASIEDLTTIGKGNAGALYGDIASSITGKGGIFGYTLAQNRAVDPKKANDPLARLKAKYPQIAQRIKLGGQTYISGDYGQTIIKASTLKDLELNQEKILKMVDPAVLTLKSFSEGFIPNFAADYIKQVMDLESNISGNKAVLDTQSGPFPFIRNSSQPNFATAISDHGGLKNALSDSINNQRNAGLMNKGFVPNFATLNVQQSLGTQFNALTAQQQSQFLNLNRALSQLARNTNLTAADQQLLSNTVRTNARALEASTGSTRVVNDANRALAVSLQQNRNAQTKQQQQTIQQTQQTQQQGRFQAFSQNLSKASTAIAIGGPLLAGFAEQALTRGRERTELSSTERMAQSGLSTGLTAVTTGAGIGAAFGPLGLAIGGTVGALIGLKSTLDAASLSAEELQQLSQKQKENTQENLSAGQRYVEAQDRYAKLLASGTASQSEMDIASKALSASFNDIKDVNLADELSKTKGGVEALNSVLNKFETQKMQLSSAIAFAGGIKGGKVEGTVNLQERARELKNAGLTEEEIKKLSSFQLQKTAITRSVSGGAGGVSRFTQEIVSESSLKEAEKLAEDISKSVIGEKGTKDQLIEFKKSISQILLGDPEKRKQLLESIGQKENNDQKAIDNAKAMANLYKIRNDNELQNIEEIAKANREIKASDFARKLGDEIFNFQNDLNKDLLSPLDQISVNLQYRSKKLVSEFDDAIKKLNTSFIEKNFTQLQNEILNPSLVENVFIPAVNKARKGDFSGIEDILLEADFGSKQFTPKFIKELKDAYKLYKENVEAERQNNKEQVDLLNLTSSLENTKEFNNNIYNKIVLDQIRLIGEQERLEIRRKTNTELEIQAIQMRMEDQGAFLGLGVIGKNQRKAELRALITAKKIADIEYSGLQSSQKEYTDIVNLRQKVLLEQASKEEQITPGGGLYYSASAMSTKPIEIKSVVDLQKAISELQNMPSFANVEMQKQKEQALQNLLKIQEQINAGKITEEEALKRINYQERLAAERSTSMRYGFRVGFDRLQDQADTLGFRLGEEIPSMFADGMSNALMEVVKGTNTLADAFKNMLINITQNIMQQTMQAAIGLALKRTVGSLFQEGGFVGKQKGGIIHAQNGMYISGNRNGDRNLAMLEDGEYVLNRKAVQAMGGSRVLDNLNFSHAPRFGKFQSGGGFAMQPELSQIGDQYDYSGNLLQNTGSVRPIDLADYSAYAFAEDDYFKKMRDKAIADEVDRVQKNFQKAQKNAQLISGIVGAVGSLAFGAGMSGLSSAASGVGRATTSLSNVGTRQLERSVSQYGSSEMLTTSGRQKGGLIGFNSGGFVPYGSRLSDTIPALLTGGEYVMNNSAVRKYGLNTMNMMNNGSMQADGGMSNTTNNSTNNNATNISINIDRSGKSVYGADSSSYEKQDIAFSKNMAKQLNAIVLKTISDEKRYGGEIYKNPVRG